MIELVSAQCVACHLTDTDPKHVFVPTPEITWQMHYDCVPFEIRLAAIAGTNFIAGRQGVVQTSSRSDLVGQIFDASDAGLRGEELRSFIVDLASSPPA